MLDQDRDVLGPGAERGDVDADDVEPVVEVFAELPFLDEQFERAVGGGGVINGSATNTFLSTSRPTDPGTGWIAIGRESTASPA